jgi:hypothetical protein
MWFKLVLLFSILTGTSSAAFVAGVRWDKAERYDESVAAVAALEEQATQSLVNLNLRWEEVATNAQINIEDWNLQHQVDNRVLDQLLAGQSIIRSQFNDIENEIYVTTDLGTCELSPDAVRLLRQSSEAANSRGRVSDS